MLALLDIKGGHFLRKKQYAQTKEPPMGSPIQSAFCDRHTPQKTKKKTESPTYRQTDWSSWSIVCFRPKINFLVNYTLQVQTFSSSRFGYHHYLLNPCTSITSYFSSSRHCPRRNQISTDHFEKLVDGFIIYWQHFKFIMTRIELIDQDYHQKTPGILYAFNEGNRRVSGWRHRYNYCEKHIAIHLEQ